MNNSIDDSSVWQALKNHVERGEEAERLLDAIWTEVGPYGHDQISLALLVKLQKFFQFDDSE